VDRTGEVSLDVERWGKREDGRNETESEDNEEETRRSIYTKKREGFRALQQRFRTAGTLGGGAHPLALDRVLST